MGCLSSEIASFLRTALVGEDIFVDYPKSLRNCTDNSVVFVQNYDAEAQELLSKCRRVLVICTPGHEDSLQQISHVISPNPRLAFARVVQRFFVEKKPACIAPTAKIGQKVRLGNDVSIGEFSVIGNGVSIGDSTVIGHHVTIDNDVVIGQNCYIKSNTVIGEKGFGFERDEEGVPIGIPHIGRVTIGNNVEIGELSSVSRGTLDDTQIGNNVKINDHVHIAHNVQIGDNVMINAGCTICGSVKIGKSVRLGPSSSIRNKMTIEDNVLVGLGAAVVKSVPQGVVVVGNPARALEKKG